MRCRDAERRLSPAVDGELAPDEVAALEAHLDGCASCRRARDEIAAVARLARALTPLDPPAALWTRIAAELDAPPPPTVAARRGAWARLLSWVRGADGEGGGPLRDTAAPRGRRLVGALGGALAVAAVALAGPALVRRAQAPSMSAATDDALLREAAQELAKAETHYRRAIADLRRYAVRERATWPEPRRRAFDTGLEELDAAVARSRRAALAEPGDVEAEELLRGAYRREIAWLERSLLDRSAFSSEAEGQPDPEAKPAGAGHEAGRPGEPGRGADR